MDKTIYTYTGRRVNGKGKVFYEYIAQGREDPAWYAKPLGPSYASIGSQFEVHLSDTGSVQMRDEFAPRYLGIIEDVEKVIAWTAKERTDLAVAEMNRRIRKDSSDPLDELLAPIRDLYRKQIGTARRSAFLAGVIEGVTR